MLLLLAVTALCGLAYLAGVWYGTKGNMTCVMTSPERIECTTDGGLLPPAAPEAESTA